MIVATAILEGGEAEGMIVATAILEEGIRAGEEEEEEAISAGLATGSVPTAVRVFSAASMSVFAVEAPSLKTRGRQPVGGATARIGGQGRGRGCVQKTMPLRSMRRKSCA